MAADHGELEKEHLTRETERLEKELAEMTHLADERLSQLKYLRAEFDNYRKWSEKEKGSVITLANENLIKDLLVILDDFEQSLPSLENEKNREGVGMVYQKMINILARYGLEPITCMGEKFDPQFHEVLCRKQCSEDADTIVEEIGKGYSLKSKVIRPSKVMVAENVSGKKGEKNG
ncbi:nucleotide exchange factor GrpE [Methanogenium sp. MK-MG]|uniref:nucleotide exchange factor GrpE n=1 Tax=Methanogenium sp. MK-MG TaxID=2599926 RepID=UPI0013EADC96|nr:nucleotide exchange factor GrpE [Methanogenium sp. MK-MG]KAF1075221.1 Protein GrpE [Methanogenium sp. MK-MG]